MSADVERSESGVYLDTAANRVVYAPPVEGVQLVPPGGELTAAAKAEVERLSEYATAEPEPVVEADEAPADEPEKAQAKKATARKG